VPLRVQVVARLGVLDFTFDNDQDEREFENLNKT
jgi:hypothetical protein